MNTIHPAAEEQFGERQDAAEQFYRAALDARKTGVDLPSTDSRGHRSGCRHLYDPMSRRVSDSRRGGRFRMSAGGMSDETVRKISEDMRRAQHRTAAADVAVEVELVEPAVVPEREAARIADGDRVAADVRRRVQID